jgi:hypothetical protein
MTDTGLRIRNVCPYWHELASDFPCMYPQRGYCLEPGRRKPRFLCRSTARQRCMSDFERCEAFRRRAQELLESLFPLSNCTLGRGQG